MYPKNISLIHKPFNLSNTQRHVFLMAISIFIMTALSACSMFSKETEIKDGPPKKPKPVAHIPNATPQAEPKSRYGNPPSYVIDGKRYHVMDSSEGYKAKGVASWYGTKFHGRRTSSGEPYDLYGMTAAHKSLPLPTYVKVKNLKNGKEIIVKVNDRGPFVDDRIIDLSYAAAKKLGVFESGTAPVEVTAINPKLWAKAKAPVSDLNQATEDSFMYLQLGAFQDKVNAEKLAALALPLATENKVNLQIFATNAAGNHWHKVRIGPISDEQLVQKLQSQILASNLPSPTIISE